MKLLSKTNHLKLKNKKKIKLDTLPFDKKDKERGKYSFEVSIYIKNENNGLVKNVKSTTISQKK